MRAILRAPTTDGRVAPGQDLVLWFEAGERFELPELSWPTVEAPRAPVVVAGPATGDATDDELESACTEEVSRGRLLRLVRREPPPTPPSLPPLAELPGPGGIRGPEPEPLDERDDEPSTGLFEPAWDEAEACDTAESPATVPSEGHRPHLSLVRTAGTTLDDDEEHLLAPPLPAPPRPGPWPDVFLPPPRPVAELPDWYDPAALETRVVLDPTIRRRRWPRWAVAAVDGAAWGTGFVLTFAVGATTWTSCGAVLFALGV